MSTRLKLVAGSIAGAVTIHVMFVACAATYTNAPGDGGVLDAMMDVIANVLDGESKDARADNDASAACACNGSPSGTRLKAYFALGDDGTKSYSASYTYELSNVFWDSQLSVPCQIGLMSDAKNHCMPGYDPLEELPSPANGYFTDMACTKPIGVGTSAVPKYATASDINSGNQRYTHVWPVLTVAPTTPPMVYEISPFAPRACTMLGNVTGTFYTLGPEVAPSALVQFSLGHD